MSEGLEKKSVEELKEMARKTNIKGYYKMRKLELIEALSEEGKITIDEEQRKTLLSQIENNPKIFELRNLAKKLGITFQRSVKKDELKERILRLLSRQHYEIKHLRSSSGSAPLNIEPVMSASTVDLPVSYHRDTLQGLPVNPSWLSFYWDFSKQTLTLVERIRIEQKPLVLRIYDVTFILFNGNNAHHQWEYRLNGKERKYYVHVSGPNACYIAEIGYYNELGSFVPLLRSNTVRTPSSGLSNKLEEKWIDLRRSYKFTQIHKHLLTQPHLLPSGISSLSTEELKNSLSSVLSTTRKETNGESHNPTISDTQKK
jgi:hypothetical protein